MAINADVPNETVCPLYVPQETNGGDDLINTKRQVIVLF